MLILDTDHLTLLERGSGASFALQMRLDPVPLEEVVTTVVTYEEQMRGWLAVMAQANTTQKVQDAYARLETHIETFSRLQLLPFDAAAAHHYNRMKRERIRISTMDMRIAAIALANDATLLTRNLRDFGKVPGLRAEDWTT